MRRLAAWQSAMFLLNSRLGLFAMAPRRTARRPHPRGRPLSRGYGASLPSSLTWFLPSTLVCSTCPPVSVCGTVRGRFKRFRRCFSAAWTGPLPPRRTGGTPSRIRLAPCPLGPAAPVAGGSYLPRHALAGTRGSRNIGLGPIGYASPPRLRGRLTLGGRTWPRKPWTFGGADSRRPFRYSCLHGRSPAVHRAFRSGFGPRATLSYQDALARALRGFGCALQSRSFSARHHSSSELLRTLQMMAASEPTSWMSPRRHILTIH